MKVAVVGTGNVGWALVTNLSRQTGIDQVMVASRSPDRAEALIMDIGSADPAASKKISYAETRQLSEADIIILTAGAQIQKGQTAADMLPTNIEIARSILSEIQFKPSVLLIALATPVDDITVFVQAYTGLPTNQVFGFGGDLDRNRLEFVLRQKGLSYENIELVGEHGGNTIPVYPEEKGYEEVASEVRGYLRKVTSLGGETRNLSTAVLLSELVESIVEDTGRNHYLCGFHPEYNIYLTWGFNVHRAGINCPKKIIVEGNAKRDLDTLVGKRRENSARICSSNTHLL